MAGFLDILHGGRIRANFPTAVGQTWSRGQVIVLRSTGNLELLGANNNVAGIAAGLALENCVSATTGNLIQNTATVIAGNTGSILLGEAVVVTDNLSGTGSWVPGSSKVYGQNGGNVSYTSTSGIGIGICLSDPVADGRMKFLFVPPVGN